MKISAIRLYRVALPIPGKGYSMSGGRVTTELDDTIIAIETDTGDIGWGESCPFGPVYLPGFPGGAREALAVLAPALIGLDPCNLALIADRMDKTLTGQPYAKSGIDMACWDLWGKATGRPCYELLGGRFTKTVPVRSGIASQVPSEIEAGLAVRRQAGYKHFSLKMGDDPGSEIAVIRAFAEAMTPDETVSVDANGGWTLHGALKVVQAFEGLDVYVEQPCATYEECRTVARRTNLPMILDESLDTPAALLRAHGDEIIAGVNLKIERCGGLTQTRLMRDMALSMGYPMYIQEVGGSEITFAAGTHLAHGVPPEMLIAASLPKGEFVTADGAPTLENGACAASDRPGLGIEPRVPQFGAPFAEFT